MVNISITYSKDGQIDNLRKLTKDDLRGLLQEIAFQIYKSGKGFITSKELLDNSAVIDYTSKVGNDNLAGTLKGILISFYFKERNETSPQGNDAGIEFFHKSLQEYLTAEKIVTTLFSEILNKDQKEKYILKREGDFLLFLNDIFNHQIITEEIWTFIAGLISKESYHEKKELCDRLLEHIDYFFEKDFLFQLSSAERQPLEKVIATFNSYWRILSHLNLQRNFVKNKEMSNKIISFRKMMYLMNGYKNEYFYLSHQHIIDTDLSSVSIFENILIGTIFRDCNFGEATIYETDFYECKFIKSEFFRFHLLGGLMKKVLFLECSFYEFEFEIDSCKEVSFKNCSFEGSKFSIGEKIRQKTILFDNVVFQTSVFDELIPYLTKFKFKDCHFRVYDRSIKNRIPQYIDVDVFEVLNNPDLLIF